MFNSNNNNKDKTKHIYEWVELEISIKCKQCNVTYSVQNLKEKQVCPLCLTRAEIDINSLNCDLISHNDIEVKYYKEDKKNSFAKDNAIVKRKLNTKFECSTCDNKINNKKILSAIENNTDYICPKCNTKYKIKNANSENKEIANNFNNGGIKIEAIIYKADNGKEEEKEYIKHSCVSCGADLKAHRTDSEIKCEYCGTLNTIKHQKVFAKELKNEKITFLIDRYQYEYNIEEERKRKKEEERRRLRERKLIDKIKGIFMAIFGIMAIFTIVTFFISLVLIILKSNFGFFKDNLIIEYTTGISLVLLLIGFVIAKISESYNEE